MWLIILTKAEFALGRVRTAIGAAVDNPAEGRNGFCHCLAVVEGIRALPLHKQTVMLCWSVQES